LCLGVFGRMAGHRDTISITLPEGPLPTREREAPEALAQAGQSAERSA